MKIEQATHTEMVVDLLWGALKRDSEHKDRRQTGWGTKTQEGLAACIRRINRESSDYADLLAAAIEILRIADITDCSEPMDEQFDPDRPAGENEYQQRLNDSLSAAQEELRAAITKAKGGRE